MALAADSPLLIPSPQTTTIGSSATTTTTTTTMTTATNMANSAHTLLNGGIYHQMISIDTIETKNTSLLIRLAHQARLIISLRPLRTGFAKDVNGSLRISRAGASSFYHHHHCRRRRRRRHSFNHHGDDGARARARSDEEEKEEVADEEDDEEEEEKEGEWLYHVIGDGSGSVRVFPRGDEYLS